MTRNEIISRIKAIDNQLDADVIEMRRSFESSDEFRLEKISHLSNRSAILVKQRMLLVDMLG